MFYKKGFSFLAVLIFLLSGSVWAQTEGGVAATRKRDADLAARA